MGVISESAVWEASVLQIEVGDSVGGGPSAVANLQAQDLANRTKWLKENKFDASNFGEFYPAGATPTYVDANTFTVPGDLTAIFTKGRGLKITDTGGTFNAICATSAYNSGTGLTTVTVAGDTIDSGISVVLYAVNQHTGAIWESGSNANGEYIKFANGTMICQKSVTTDNATNTWGSLYQSGSKSVGTFPAAFIEIPYCNMMWIQGSNGLAMPAMSSGALSETTGPNIAIVRPITHAYGGTVNITAIGRWF